MGVREGSAVTVTIDRLVVDGLSRPAVRRLAGALERELGRLLEQRGVPARLAEAGELPGLRLDDLTAAPGAPPERLGRSLAAALYRQLERRRPERRPSDRREPELQEPGLEEGEG